MAEDKLKLMMVASEAAPFVKTGGLGDVVGSLPLYLKNKLDDLIIVLPLYKTIKAKYFEMMNYVGEVNFLMSWRKQKAGIYFLENEGLKYYFVEGSYYFERDYIYGGEDEIERFAFFNFASLELLALIKYKPDIIHLHDWQAAMIAPLYKEVYAKTKSFQNIKLVLTIHNPAFQGICHKEALGNLFNLPDRLYEEGIVRFKNNVSTLKAGIMYADYITTVSPTNAKELINGFYSYDLHHVLRFREYDLYGILNGINYKEYNPYNDKLIKEKYNFETIDKKSINKEDLQEMFKIEVNPSKLLCGVVSRLTSQKGINLILENIPFMVKNNMQLIVIGNGEKAIENALQSYRDLYPNDVGIYIGFSEDLAHHVYSGIDLYLMPSLFEPCGLSQMIAQRYGSVPLVREVGGLKDSVEPYNEYNKVGTGFSFAKFEGKDFKKVLTYASKIYFERKDEWKEIIRQCMEKDNSWKKSAISYLKLYKKLVKEK